MSRVPTNGIDYTSKDYESFRNDMIKNLRVKMPEYTDIRQSDAGIVILELLAMGLDIISYYQDVIANEAFLVTEEQRSNALKWCKMLSYIPKASTPAEFTQVFVLSSVQTTDTTIPKGTQVKTLGTSVEPSIYFETQEDLVIPAGALGDEMQDGKYLYSVKVVQGVSVSGELVGSSRGSANQSFKLHYSPVILDSISILINEGNGFEEWTRVDNFIDSSSTSRHYTVTIDDNDEATIIFGDGVFGKIPKTYESGIYCNYRVGGGTQGNVGANKITLLDTNLALVNRTFNPSTADIEGQDKESLEEIKRNAPTAFRTVWGALTIDDFADVVLANFSEVDKASSYVVGDDGRDVDIYVLLKDDAVISEGLQKRVLSMFDENDGGRKLIGAGQVTLLPAIKTPVDISAALSVKPRYDFETVKANITEFLSDYFAVGNRDFNTELSFSELCAEVMNPGNAINGIRYFKITSPTDDVLTPSNGVIHTLGTLTITEGGV